MIENTLDYIKEKFISYLKESNKSPFTIQNYDRTLRYFCGFLKQKKIDTISDINQEVIFQYQDYIYERLDHAEKTLKFYINDIRRFFDHLMKMGIVYTNPVQDMQIKQKRVEQVEVITRYYSIDEIIRKYRHCLKNKDISFSFYEAERVHTNTFFYFLKKQDIASIYKVSSEVIERYKKYLNSNGCNNQNGYNVYDQIEKLRSLRRFYKWLIKEKMIKSDPTAYLNIGKHEKFLKRENKPQPKPRETSPKSQIQLYQDKILEYKKSLGLSPKTIKRLRYHLDIFILFLKSKGITTIEAVKREDILCFLNYISNVYKTFKGTYLSQSTKSSFMSAVKDFFAFLAKFEYIQKDPALSIDSLKSDQGIPRTLMTQHEVNTILDMPNLNSPIGIRDKAILETLYSTGMRASELTHLEVDDIDFTQGLLRINFPKGGRPRQRIIPIGRVALDYITLYLKQARPYLLNGDKNLLFLTRTGKILSHDDLRIIIKGYVFKARFKKNITTHSFRVTCATEMLRNKADIRYVQQQLGHEKITSTQVYARVIPIDLKKVHSRTHPRERARTQIAADEPNFALPGQSFLIK